MSALLFFIGAIGAIGGAVGVVVLRDPFYAVLALVGHLLSLALLFLLLRAEFVAAVQVVVYAGAVMVLYVFVVAYVGEQEVSFGDRLRRGGGPVGSGLRLGAVLVGGAVLVELFIALLGSGLKAIDGYGAGYAPGPRTYGTPAWIGNLLLTRFLLVFEISSFLLLVAAVGAVVLARRRGGLGEPPAELTPLGLTRPLGTGTMAEGVEGRVTPRPAPHAPAPAGQSATEGRVPPQTPVGSASR
ncbi:MAG TPA: NADH-quinone oxidoreductase subunit J [Solirubrobacteraceae bacterium]|nr:NADH-quinone oxidoreductase subunit J [Solirubrobacteraceae bacterium]